MKRDKYGNLYWEEYYKHLPIPKDWENVSFMVMMNFLVLNSMAITSGLIGLYSRRENRII